MMNTNNSSQQSHDATTAAAAASSSNLQLQRFILIVEYDGSKYSGFQRQTSPNSTIAQNAFEYRKHKQKKQQQTTTNTNTSTMTKRSLQRNCPLTIQECIEDSILKYCNTNLLSKHRQTTRKQQQKKKRQRQEEGEDDDKSNDKQQDAVTTSQQQQEEEQKQSQSKSTMTRSDMDFKFASRTDGGVHARGQVIAVNLPIMTSLSLRNSTNNTKNEGDGKQQQQQQQQQHSNPCKASQIDSHTCKIIIKYFLLLLTHRFIHISFLL